MFNPSNPAGDPAMLTKGCEYCCDWLILLGGTNGFDIIFNLLLEREEKWEESRRVKKSLSTP
jgi:hypothetical protein